MPDTKTMTSAELYAAAREVERSEMAAKALLADSVQPVYQFTLTPTDSSFDKIFDGSGCSVYKLSATVVNKAEVEAVGGKIREGGLSYLFNHLNGRFVCSTGGGQIWLDDGTFGKPFDVEAFTALANYLLEVNIDGGDVTEIILAARSKKV